MDWPGSIITDSGGYQVFSLAKLKENYLGVHFNSPVDGKEVLLDQKIYMVTRAIRR